jgi:uncharacterized membrane protein
MNPTQEHFKVSRSWLIPLAYAVASLAMAMVLPRLEHQLSFSMVAKVSASSAEAICSSVASGMIALTGIVFSLTFVMVQFSATAYSPRLVMWVARDPVISHALGIFNATFLYALLLLGWIDRNETGKVPFVSGWFLIMMLIASMGMFIVLIDRIRLLQVSRMLIFTGNQGRMAIKKLYGSVGSTSPSITRSELDGLRITQTLIHSGRPQVIEAVQVNKLVSLATQSNVVIELLSAVGDTVSEMSPLLQVHGTDQVLDESALRQAIEIGDERTFEQDPKYAIRLVVDIAIKALSPAINDPTTAVQALDQVEDLLLRLGFCRLEIEAFRDHAGKLRLIVVFPTWDDLLRLAFDEICAYGAASVQVMRRMRALTQNLIRVLPPERHEALRHWERRLSQSIERSFADAESKRHASVADRQGLGISPEDNIGT